MIPISILLPRQHFWSRRAIKTRAVDTPIGSQSWSRPFDPTASVPACVYAARQRDLFGFFLFLRFIRSLLCLTSSPAVHKHTTHPAALSLSLSPAPPPPLRFISVFPAWNHFPPSRSHFRRSSPPAAVQLRQQIYAGLSLIFGVPHKRKRLPYLLLFPLFFFGLCWRGAGVGEDDV